jgi:LysM repeat protein
MGEGRRWAAMLLLWSLGSCGWLGSEPTDPSPPTYVVQRGDTLFLIARDHGVTVDELRAWNGLQGDLIEVDQVLVVGGAGAPPVAAPAPARPRPRPAPKPAAGLSRPAPEPCLEGPTDIDAERGMAASEGLSAAAASAALDAIAPHLAPCLRDGTPSGALVVDLQVACTGVVRRVDLVDAADWSDDARSCVIDRLSYADFPAHGLPDGDVVRYPLRFTP